LGHQQAQETGKFLDSWLSEKGFTSDDLTWMSSPFLRCLQTSDDALNSFRKVDVLTMPILPEYSIFEWDGHGGEWHLDLPPMKERKHYFPRLDVDYESYFIPELPGRLTWHGRFLHQM
jgi:broad specificity phosphatase PhoE